jgi:hypothetical protein
MASLVRLATVLTLLASPLAALAYDGPVEKKTFTVPQYQTIGGRTRQGIRSVPS